MNVVNPQRTLNILKHAVELDTNGRYTEALVCYKEGIHLTSDIIKAGFSLETTVRPLIAKMEQYVERVERLHRVITQKKEDGQFHEQIQINDNSTGHSYESLFGRFLDYDVLFVAVEDAYVRNFYQCQNFLRLCELLVRKCLNLRHIALVTSKADVAEGEQDIWFGYLKNELSKHNITLLVKYSNVFHDTCITLSSGWIIELSRGLDLYKPTMHKYSLGANDLNLRHCHEATVDIYHSKNIKPLRNLFFEHAFFSYICRMFSVV